MRLLNLLPLALSASAFLIPAQVPDKVDIVDVLPAVAMHERVNLKCVDGCPTFMVKDTAYGRPKSTIQTFKSKLNAYITSDDGMVLLNGVQIWPQITRLEPMTMVQVIDERTEPSVRLLPVSTAIEYKPNEVLVDSQGAITIHPVVIEIMAVVDEVVRAESLEIRIAETAAGVGLLPSKIHPYKASPFTDSCTNVWCRVQGTIMQKYRELREAAAKKLNSWRGCGGRMRHHKAGGAIVKGGPAKFGSGSSLRPNHHHGAHHHHHRGRFMGFLRRVVMAMMPAVFGLSIGLAIGSLIKVLVLRLARRRALAHGDYTQVEQSEVEEARVSTEGLPKYEDVYGEVESEKVDEKKDLQ